MPPLAPVAPSTAETAETGGGAGAAFSWSMSVFTSSSDMDKHKWSLLQLRRVFTQRFFVTFRFLSFFYRVGVVLPGIKVRMTAAEGETRLGDQTANAAR
jgi:hypothetical protein